MCEDNNYHRKEADDHLWQPLTRKWFAVIFGTTLLYAILRYHIAKQVPWEHLPLFILNKAISFAAVVFVACSYLIGRVFRWYDHDLKRKRLLIKFCGLAGFSLATIHVLFSVCLLNPAYFQKFYTTEARLNLVGELGLAFGIISLWALAIPAISTFPTMPKALGGKRWKRAQHMGYLSLLLVVGHLFVFGVKGWLIPTTWPWYMPPISLLALVVAMVPLLAKIRSGFIQHGKN